MNRLAKRKGECKGFTEIFDFFFGETQLYRKRRVIGFYQSFLNIDQRFLFNFFKEKT